MYMERTAKLTIGGGKFSAKSSICEVFRMDAYIRNYTGMAC
jgi:hypothetical protein